VEADGNKRDLARMFRGVSPDPFVAVIDQIHREAEAAERASVEKVIADAEAAQTAERAAYIEQMIKEARAAAAQQAAATPEGAPAAAPASEGAGPA
jgi:hypothetical protein